MKQVPHRGVDLNRLPIYNQVLNQYDHLKILRDEKGRWIEGIPEEVRQGWYQNKKGDLYHYDGVVWDKVPEEQIKSLEYLG